ncbi:hypothetical protein [Arthrobacter sp. Br18]|uniref:hypothetical protein n=1 Tax=Arthrobacter sp. Br18 TaxID=1312954 RepID=UPI0004BAA1EC|nr:hypothetical protein [Arthrobacter sp. Br18]
MNQNRNVLDRAAERILQLDSASYGDERERAVYTEAATFGMTASLYMGIIGAFITALLGLILVPILLVVFSVIPMYCTMWYAGRRGVNTMDLASRASDRSLTFQAVFTLSVLLLTIGAMGFTGWAGRGLIPLVDAVSISADTMESLGSGAVMGGAVGAVLGVLATGFAIRQARRKCATEAPAPDTE